MIAQLFALTIVLKVTKGTAAGGFLTFHAPYSCQSDAFFGDLVNPSNKGFTMDDNTLENCSAQSLETWPYTSLAYKPEEKVKKLRVFQPWAPDWPETKRVRAWTKLVSYIKRNDVQVLMGTRISCFPDDDRQVWQWTKELISLIGHEHIMGLSIGNELELFYMFRKELRVDDACLHRLWDGGYAYSWFKEVVAEFDAMGYGHIPITSVFGARALSTKTSTFTETPVSRVNTLLSKLVSDYKERFVFAFNLYPYFDPKLKLDKNTRDQCNGALSYSLCWEPDCSLPREISKAREKITNLTGNPNWRMWLTEVGWASEFAPTLLSAMKNCPRYSSPESLLTFYKGFLAWDLTISGASKSLKPPEMAFWHTMRDAPQLGTLEHFGLVKNCGDRECKTVPDPGMLAIPEPPPGFNPQDQDQAENAKDDASNDASGMQENLLQEQEEAEEEEVSDHAGGLEDNLLLFVQEM